ncbi:MULTISPECIES: hypothetical protein [unclassified Lentimicrobium]|uniref:hypothetical protein n=1 Tax=unclassified Lentimicrobium TaxID=2677434 RepID=UPI001552D504|nr:MULTISPECIES: hypothetical protein [unclassified Lentimicrobium]NPD45228.1 hypothetical protein [Lentimicrobium sp. S6]NPD85407.1 hypothetical protein [Lentimicrobium sp. L6]
MNVFTQKITEAKIINSPEYQEYLEFLEEEAMSKNPDQFCFEMPDRNNYDESELNIFSYNDQLSDQSAALEDINYSGYEIISAAI